MSRPTDTGRLTKRAQFLAARSGQKRRGRYFLVEALDRGDAEPPRFGLTVSRKVGNAVERNRVKRRLRAAVQLGAGAEMAPGHDYVIIGRRELLAAPFAALQAELTQRVRGKG